MPSTRSQATVGCKQLEKLCFSVNYDLKTQQQQIKNSSLLTDSMAFNKKTYKMNAVLMRCVYIASASHYYSQS